jgi:hypothetical protein
MTRTPAIYINIFWLTGNTNERYPVRMEIDTKPVKKYSENSKLCFILNTLLKNCNIAKPAIYRIRKSISHRRKFKTINLSLKNHILKCRL